MQEAPSRSEIDEQPIHVARDTATLHPTTLLSLVPITVPNNNETFSVGLSQYNLPLITFDISVRVQSLEVFLRFFRKPTRQKRVNGIEKRENSWQLFTARLMTT